MQCPECQRQLRQNSRSCACGWKSISHTDDFQAKRDARIRDPSQTQVLICRGDHPPGQHHTSEITWFPGDNRDGPRACEWQTRGRRCRMIGFESDFCGFHRACLNNGWDHPTLKDFAEWLSESERWQGDLGFLWARLTGEIWIIPTDNGPPDSSEPAGSPRTKAEAQELAGALARGVSQGKRGVVAELRKMAAKYPANAAWYHRESDRMERECETEKAGEVAHANL